MILDVLAEVARALDDAQVPWMLAGSHASTFHGVPRATNDIDVVVDLPGKRIPDLAARLPSSRWYLDQAVALESILSQRPFNVIDEHTGVKIDFMPLKRRPFSRSEFDRRVRVQYGSASVWVATVEDTILAKLEWSKKSGGSERQLRDVAGLVEAWGDRLDRSYLESWLDELGVREAWLSVRQ